MNITAAQVNELRQMTGAGMMDCKKALVETDGNIEQAIDILRKKGMAKAAKRADRTASEGCVFSKCTDDHKYAAVIMLNCETDFVANNADFVKFTKDMLDMAVEKRVKNMEDLLKMPYNNVTVEEAIANESAVTGEKTELGAFKVLEGAYVTNYNHPGNRLSVILEMSKTFGSIDEIAHEVALHIAAMNPLAISETNIAQDVKDREYQVAIEKTKAEQIDKAVEVALKKAGFNPAWFDSDAHIESNMAKGWFTQEDADKVREIKAKTAEEKAANLPEQMIANIANGRLNKFFKENCLLNQVSLVADPKTVGQYIQDADKEATVNNFVRIKLGE